MTKLGNGLSAQRDNHHAIVYKNGQLLKRVDLENGVERRLLIVDLVKRMGAAPTKVAEGLDVSRQTVHNAINSFDQYGPEGLLHSGKNGIGNKARLHEERRKEAREQAEQEGESQEELALDGEVPENFNQTYDWQKSRYAGGMIVSAVLEKDWQFMPFFFKIFGKLTDVFVIFAQMLIHGIKSIEQLKAVKRHELGLACGIEQTPSRTTFSVWLRLVVLKNQAVSAIKQFFSNQIKAGLVSCYLLYVDGHFIPYSGKTRIHKGYYTQRRLAMPGQTTIVFHDATGRIVHFRLEEGSGDMRQAIEDLSSDVRIHLGESVSPLVISDRASWDVEHFDRMSDHRLLTWEKHTNKEEIETLAEDLFSDILVVNEHRYRFYEFPEEKTYYNADKTISVELRRIVIWNLDSNRRPVCVTNDTLEDTLFIGQAMLGRWGNSENGFKYLGDRFNPHYIPLLRATEDSENQEVSNPVFKELQQQKQKIKTQLQKNATQLANTKEVYNKDGSVRNNSKHQRLSGERAKLEGELVIVEYDLKATPERINLPEATDGKQSFKVIDTEAKSLFDLVQAMVWNARRNLIDMLKNHYHDERDVVNLLDHITRCHGWIKSTAKAVYVRLEPMDVPRYRAAQKELCQSLNHLEARLPNGKILKFSVGDAPV
jgi:transposase